MEPPPDAVPLLSFTQSLQRFVDAPALDVTGTSVREVLDAYFERHPGVKGYVLDDQGAIRHHVAVFLNGQQIQDRTWQSDPVAAGDSIYVIQALSGG